MHAPRGPSLCTWNAIRFGPNWLKRAERWFWSSARFWADAEKVAEDRPSYLEVGTVKRPRDWLSWVNQAVRPGELEAIRRSVIRGLPYGGPPLSARTAAELGLESTLRPRGRPKKKIESEQDGGLVSE